MYESKERARGISSGLSVICYAVVARNRIIKAFHIYIYIYIFIYLSVFSFLRYRLQIMKRGFV